MKILVVDDQKANQIMLEGLLTGMGHSVVCVDNGQRALEVFNSVQPQIVLLDVMMPVLNGFETAPRLKELSGNVHLPIIFITALDAKDTLLRCLQVGGDDFLSVPFEPVVLQAKISAHGRVRELSYSLAQKNKTLNWHSNRMEREQSVVQHMLHNALRENELNKPYIKSYLRSVSTFNGDLCLGKEGPFGNYYLFLGDFTGHGLAPATGTLPLSQAFFGMASRGLSVSDMAAEFNQRLLNLLPDDMFCAALIIELSPGGERLTCWNGGIPDALVINSSGEVQHHIPSRHMALGILSTEDFDNQVEHLFVSQDHSVIAFTDGVVEMQLADKAMLGEAGFTQMVSRAWQCDPEQAFENVCQQLKQMMDANQQIHDDLSLVVLDCKRNAPVDSKQSTEHNHLPFTLSVTIGKREVEKLDPMQQLVDSLGKLEALKSHKTTLYLLFAECFNNILDHNVLQLDSDMKEVLGFERYYVERQQRLRQNQDFAIQIDIHYTPVEERISFAISSNGECPFPVDRTGESVATNEQLFGRGLELVKNFADKVEWREQGRILFVDYDLSRPPA
ncbi:response regulator receiver domain-containing protein [Idiomarina aquatica]|uniref:Response regulator receiver domain-containing protein n=2 Tax=Idiomarina TaxID=135575 RepID=A0A4R6P054_9GAMM|nr:SpoIIE family protein phosphatase [Idiomarina aquatica]TDP31014.1 response regulator receiver domain-containing protein [Idiomarina aquatica]